MISKQKNIWGFCGVFSILKKLISEKPLWALQDLNL